MGSLSQGFQLSGLNIMTGMAKETQLLNSQERKRRQSEKEEDKDNGKDDGNDETEKNKVSVVMDMLCSPKTHPLKTVGSNYALLLEVSTTV